MFSNFLANIFEYVAQSGMYFAYVSALLRMLLLDILLLCDDTQNVCHTESVSLVSAAGNVTRLPTVCFDILRPSLSMNTFRVMYIVWNHVRLCS